MVVLNSEYVADEIDRRHRDLLTGVERWGALVADRLDALLDSLAPLEALTRVAPGIDDEVAFRRAARSYTEMVEELGGVGAALRAGPPANVGYRLRALASDLRESSAQLTAPDARHCEGQGP